MNYRKRIGNNLKYYRQESQLTSSELANKLGLTQSSISKYENGEIKKIDIGLVEDFARAIGCTAAQLAGWETGNSSEFLESYNRLPLNKQRLVNEYINILNGSSNKAQYQVSRDEIELIKQFRTLNGDGKERLLDSLDDMVRSGKYIKSSEHEILEKEA